MSRMTAAQMMQGARTPQGSMPASKPAAMPTTVVKVPKGGQATIRKAQGGTIVTVTDANWKSEETVVSDISGLRVE